MNAIVSEKGQVTIPKEIRDKLGLQAGVVLDFREENGQLIAEKKLSEDRMRKWIGAGTLPVGKTVDEYIDIIRDR